jgi:hypothetical protein
MVSRSRCQQELAILIGRAQAHSMLSVLVNCHELSLALGAHAATTGGMLECIGAMEDACCSGDRVVLGKSTQLGLTIRYILPRIASPE